jgi:phosphopantetheine--protein transferase-like protein
VPGTELHCHIRITELTDAVLEADVQLRVGGTVWAEVRGWQDRRFDSHPETRPVERFADRNTLSAPRPGGWVVVHERWPDLASRDLIMRNHLGAAERARYEQQPPRGRRAWLLGRIAVKDAVRRLLWESGEGPVFPAEIAVLNDESGQPRAIGLHGRTLPALAVSLAHRGETAVAMVRPAEAGPVGIDLEEVTERTPELLQVALSPDEQAVVTSHQDAALWFTRFWAAKEAVAKAEGTGLRGRPRDFTVVAAEPTALVVETPGRRRYTVHCAELDNPPGLPPRHYVVAWTEAPAERTPRT